MTTPKRDKRIDYVEIPAKDLKVAKAFFGDVFGWTFVDYGPDYCSFNDGQLEGGFFTADFAVTSQTSILLVFFNDDLPQAQQNILAAGGTIVKETFSFPGGERFHFADPNGNEYAMWREFE